MEMSAFFKSARPSLFGNRMTASQVSGIERLIAAWDKYGTGLDTGMAYTLAVSYHETGKRMQPVRETNATSTAQAIARLDKAFKSGKLKWVKTPYWRTGFFGRGDVQLTHESNYSGPLAKAVLKEFGVDIHADPDAALRPDVSAFIMIEGMTRGHTTKSDFTAHALEDFINDHKTDYDEARKTVNPGEKDSYKLIGDYARKFEKAIRAARAAAGEEFTGFDPNRVVANQNIYDGKYHQSVYNVQELLDAKGYPEVGAVDGRYGNKTATAIMAFRRENGLPVNDRIDEGLMAALVMAGTRAIAIERATATVSDLRKEGAKDIIAADNTKVIGYVGVAAGALTGVTEAVEAAEGYSDLLQRVSTLFEPIKSLIVDNIWLLLVGGGAYVVFQSGLLQKIRLRKHRTGEDVSA